MTDSATLAEIRALRADFRALASMIAAREGVDLLLLGAFLAACYSFYRDSAWSASDLIADARRFGQHDLLGAIDTITAGCKEQDKSLGKFCRRHEGFTLGGKRIQRVKRLWSVCADETA